MARAGTTSRWVARGRAHRIECARQKRAKSRAGEPHLRLCSHLCRGGLRRRCGPADYCLGRRCTVGVDRDCDRYTGGRKGGASGARCTRRVGVDGDGRHCNGGQAWQACRWIT